MSNAAKHRKKAAEFEQLKQIDRAIASYVKAIEESEAAGEDVDVALYNKVGDLALRQGRVPDAITYYERAVEHYATSGLFNNAIALCNKILRSAPGRANVYFTLGRISARKGLRNDATRNFLEYATRMQQDGRIEEGIRALAEVLDIMPELNDVRTAVESLAARAGIALPRRRTPLRTDRVPTPASTPAVREQKSQDLIFLDIDYGTPTDRPTKETPRVPTPSASLPVRGPEIIDLEPETPAPGLPLLDIGERPSEGMAEIGTPGAAPLEGLEANGEFAEVEATPVLEGFTPEEPLTPAEVVDPSVHPADVTWLTPPVVHADALPLERLNAESVPELDAVEEILPPTRPPFRLDPHDFILPGELPPLLLDDEVVNAGLEPSEPSATVRTEGDALPNVEPMGAESAAAESDVGGDVMSQGAAVDASPSLEAMDLGDALADEEYVVDTDETVVPPVRPVSVTPSLPIAAVAEVAATVASSRRDSLRAAVARLPKNWLLRRRLAEALFEAGERDAALHELETAQQGLLNDGEFDAAADIADELVHVSPDRIAYHQKRVELAVRSSDPQRLRFAYLDLADALVRLGEEGRARAVYARVLEIDPFDDRARAALGAAAPPPPPPPASRADGETFVDLAHWLQDDGPANTRMRMREPAISGDEQADFDALLRHFKEGVSRALGEDDFESHYDLGVAYKEMGLLDDAITEFQKALRSRAHRLPAYEALGQCFVEQGRFQVAATVLSRALHEPGLDDEKRVGVLYLLGYSCEALQRKDEARGYFQRVYATDINFRDVAARLAAIEQAPR
jgi:tetratricopeptide (TPR) repeat protein